MSAKEMFEKLGYEYVETNNYIEYIKYYYKHWIFKDYQKIIFFKSPIYDLDIFDRLGTTINRDLLQAINKQVEELGWLESDKE